MSKQRQGSFKHFFRVNVNDVGIVKPGAATRMKEYE